VDLLEAFEGHGVQLAFQELGVESVHVGFEARYVYLSTVLSLHFVAGMNGGSETQPISWGGSVTKRTREDLQFFRGEESPFEHVVPDLAAFYAVNVLLRLRANVGVRSRRKEVDVPLLADDPTGPGTGFEPFWARGREIKRSIGHHWALDLGVRQRRKMCHRRELQRVGERV